MEIYCKNQTSIFGAGVFRCSFISKHVLKYLKAQTTFIHQNIICFKKSLQSLQVSKHNQKQKVYKLLTVLSLKRTLIRGPCSCVSNGNVKVLKLSTIPLILAPVFVVPTFYLRTQGYHTSKIIINYINKVYMTFFVQ